MAKTEESSFEWRQDYVRTFLERDIPNLGIRIPSLSLRRFWMMVCHYHGQVLNTSEIGKALGISHTTARRYIEILSETFMLRILPPWYENIKKRQLKSPKIFFRDSGLFHLLMNIPDKSHLQRNPKLGASWEGFALEEVIRHYRFESENVYFWGVHGQSELDLMVLSNGKKIGFEIKYTDSPRVTSSMKSATDQLKLDRLIIVYPGKKRFQLAPNIQAVGLSILNTLRI